MLQSNKAFWYQTYQNMKRAGGTGEKMEAN